MMMSVIIGQLINDVDCQYLLDRFYLAYMTDRAIYQYLSSPDELPHNAVINCCLNLFCSNFNVDSHFYVKHALQMRRNVDEI